MKKGKNNLKVLQQTYVFIFEILNSGPDNSDAFPTYPLVRFYRQWCVFCRPKDGRWWTEMSAEAGVLYRTGYSCRLLRRPKSDLVENYNEVIKSLQAYFDALVV